MSISFLKLAIHSHLKRLNKIKFDHLIISSKFFLLIFFLIRILEYTCLKTCWWACLYTGLKDLDKYQFFSWYIRFWWTKSMCRNRLNISLVCMMRKDTFIASFSTQKILLFQFQMINLDVKSGLWIDLLRIKKAVL